LLLIYLSAASWLLSFVSIGKVSIKFTTGIQSFRHPLHLPLEIRYYLNSFPTSEPHIMSYTQDQYTGAQYQTPTSTPQIHLQDYSNTPAPINSPQIGQHPGSPPPQYPSTMEKQHPGFGGVQQQQSYQQPPNTEGRKNHYQNATPLGSLQQSPAPVDCPRCGVRELTRVEYVSGGTAHASAAACCLCFCLGCIPYLFSGFKDVEHKCSACGAPLATWHRSGRTEVLAHS